jgi:hypothetical protein
MSRDQPFVCTPTRRVSGERQAPAHRAQSQTSEGFGGNLRALYALSLFSLSCLSCLGAGFSSRSTTSGEALGGAK